jgi:hypothetical protein
LWVFDSTGTALLARGGDPAPGTDPGVSFLGLPDGLVPVGFDRAAAACAVPATLRGPGVDHFNDDGVCSGDAGALHLVLREGDPAPGTGGRWTTLHWPRLSDGGHVAFLASIQEGSYPRHGVFWDQPVTVMPVLLPGSIPDRPGLTLFEARQIVGFTAGGYLVFRAFLDVPSAAALPALIGAAPDGTVRTLVAAGDAVDVAPGGGDPRWVAAVGPGEVAENGTLALRLGFADGSSGVFTLVLPGLG